MSHVVDIDLAEDERVTDLEAFKSAVQRANGQLHQGQTSFTYYRGQKDQCDHAATLDNGRQMGLVAQGDGTFGIKCDSMDRHRVDNVLMFYQMECAKAAAEAVGDIYSETLLEDGTYLVECDTTVRMGG
jgi:hypothetical protein